jgi:hypothetical protein
VTCIYTNATLNFAGPYEWVVTNVYEPSRNTFIFVLLATLIGSALAASVCVAYRGAGKEAPVLEVDE